MSLLAYHSHPGALLRRLYLDPLGMSAMGLARAIGVPRTRTERLLKGERGVTPETALRLARYFGTTPEMWLNLQAAHDLAEARRTVDLSGITPREADAA